MSANSGLGIRLLGSRATVTGAADSLESINTFELETGTLVFICSNEELYSLNKLSTASPSGDSIVAPAQGGPGRWFKKTGSSSTVLVAEADAQTLQVSESALLTGMSIDVSALAGQRLLFTVWLELTHADDPSTITVRLGFFDGDSFTQFFTSLESLVVADEGTEFMIQVPSGVVPAGVSAQVWGFSTITGTALTAGTLAVQPCTVS